MSSFFHVQGSVYEHPILKRDSASRCCNAHPDSRSLDDAMVEFEQLLLNKSFLLTLIDTLERQPLITISERSNIASLLTVVLMGQQLDYLSEVLKMLLTRLIEQSVASRQPKLMLRRCDSLCEKLLSNWLALAQHDGIRNGAAGKSLFLMYKAVKHQVESGPVDAVTHQARYSLSEQRLLREKVDALPIMLYLQHPSMCATNAQGEENIYATPPVQCRVLNCDTVKQVKIKLLDALYGNSPARFRTSHNDVDLEWIHASHGAITLKDDDASSERDEFGCVRINTLQHYGMREQAVVSLVFRNTCSAQSSACGHCSSSSASSTSSCSASSSPATYSLSSTPQLLLPQGGGANCHVMGSSSGVSSASCQACSNADIYQRTRNCRHATIARYEQKQSNKKKWHLVRPDYGCQSMLLASYDKHSNIYLSSKRGQEYPFPKQISPPSSTSTIAELYLTRLLSTKGTLQQFIDDFFNQALSTDKNSGAVSPGLKWLFDIYDSAALDLDIGDDVVHAWKSNSLNLRFWSNIINNPDFIFDVEKSSSVDSCLTVIAQTLMDACSQNEHIRLGKDSPSSKLLFAKDIPRYRAMVKKFYAAIREQPVVEGDKLNRWLHSISTKYSSDLNTMHALKELYSYTSKYETELVELLDDDPMCRRMNLSHKLDAISASLSYYTVPRLPINQSLTMRSHKTNPGIAMGVQSYSNCLTLSSRATNNNTILLPTGNKTLQPALIMPPPPNSHPPICTQAFQYQTHYPARN